MIRRDQYPESWCFSASGLPMRAVRAGLEKRFEGIPDVHYGDDRHWVCTDGVNDGGVSEWTLTGTLTAGQEIEVRGIDLLEFDQQGKITRKDSFWKIVE